jgi:hypothetical protein
MPFVDSEQIDIIQTGDTTFQLVHPVAYRGKLQSFVVPAGQDTDLASVPVGLTWLIPRYGRWTKAAILHDYLWRTGVITKSDADGVFRRALRELGVPIHKRWVMWSAVRLASITKHGGLPGTPFKHLVSLAILWPTLVAFLAVPTLIVYLFSFLFWLFGKIVHVFDK